MIELKKRYLLCLFALLPALLWGQEPAERQKRYEELVAHYFDYYQRDVADSAEMALREALLLVPDHGANFLLKANLAELVVARRDTAEAVSLLSEALAAHPEMTDIRSRRAELFEKSGKAQDALSDLEILINEHPKNEVYRYRRALVLIGQKLWNGAASDLEEIVRNNPNGYLPRVALAATDFERGRELDAEQALSQLVSDYPEIHVAARVLTGLYLRQGRKSDAHETIRKVISEGKVVTAEDYLTRAFVWVGYGEKAEAEKDFKKAVELGASEAVVSGYKTAKDIMWKPIMMQK